MNKKVEKIPLSIVIITHRNDARFVHALKSSQIAKETIVVDNNSDNDWKKLKRDYDFKVVSHEKKITNFSKVRNQTLREVKSDWILFLDSDESLGNKREELESNRVKIGQIIEDDLFDGVTITRRDVFLGKTLKFGEAGNTRLLRMFKTKKGKFVRNVHEVVDLSGNPGGSEIVISHFSHLDISGFLKSITTYAKMAAENERSSGLENILKMVIYPLVKFIQNYIIKLGFLDGYRGLIYVVMMSLHSFFVRVFYFEKYFQENSYEHN